MKHLLLTGLHGLVFAASMAMSGQTLSQTQASSVLRSTELRADKLPAASVLSTLAPGAPVTVLNLEGGWAQVQLAAARASARPLTGWVRASSLNWQAGQAEAATMVNGRLAANTKVLSLGVRQLNTQSSRHALIIGISEYADPRIPRLPGVAVDTETATQMARAMQVPDGNIRYLRDAQASADGIRRALAELSAAVDEGDRVFVHYSGHGTRFTNPQGEGCTEALLAYDGGQSGVVTNRELAQLLKPLTQKADKLFVMYDACYSGGVAQAANTRLALGRGLVNSNDEGALRPKFALTTEDCSRPSNMRSRSLVDEAAALGTQSQDIVHLSASRDDEISFDDERKGGLATQFMRDCMLRDALDLDASGAVTIDEIRQCAQGKLDRRMKNDPVYKAPTITVKGNTSFVPAWFSQNLSPPAATAAPAPASPSSNVSASVAVNASPPVVAPAPLSGEQALRQVFNQRDAKRRVDVSLAQPTLRIGQDALALNVQSDRAGYVYIALAGSDNQALYLLFPNDLDRDNRIAANQALTLPRPHWRVKAAGPAGTDQLLVIVSDNPRELGELKGDKTGPFTRSLNDTQGRARLGEFMVNASVSMTGQCQGPGPRATAACSDAYGAALLSVQERP